MHTFMSLCVVGLGYIGLPAAAVFAKSGLQVMGVDINPKAVDSINKGKAHVAETDLDGLLHGVVANGAFKYQTAPTKADAFIIAVPTPFTDGHKPDLSFIEASTRAIAALLKQAT